MDECDDVYEPYETAVAPALGADTTKLHPCDDVFEPYETAVAPALGADTKRDPHPRPHPHKRAVEDEMAADEPVSRYYHHPNPVDDGAVVAARTMEASHHPPTFYSEADDAYDVDVQPLADVRPHAVEAEAMTDDHTTPSSTTTAAVNANAVDSSKGVCDADAVDGNGNVCAGLQAVAEGASLHTSPPPPPPPPPPAAVCAVSASSLSARNPTMIVGSGAPLDRTDVPAPAVSVSISASASASASPSTSTSASASAAPSAAPSAGRLAIKEKKVSTFWYWLVYECCAV